MCIRDRPGTRADARYYGGKPDALIAGLNVEISNKSTLIRRPGLLEYSTASIPQPPTAFYSFQQTSGTIDVIVDTASVIYSVTPTAKTTVFTKGGGAGQAFFQGVGDTLYFGDGVEQKQWWDASTIYNWGIAAPTAAPTVTLTSLSLIHI